MERPLQEMEKVREFVRDALGCSCPEEVFDHVRVQYGVETSEGKHLGARIDVGGRLLVYIVDASNPVDTVTIREVLQSGMKERDRDGFNRFRLVLEGGKTDSVVAMLRDISASADGRGSSLADAEGLDDKVHVHILTEGLL